MKRKVLVNRLSLLALILTFSVGYVAGQNVGIGEASPNSKLDLVQTGATGNTVEVNHNNNTSGSSAVFVINNGIGRAVNAVSLNTGNNIPAIQSQQFGTGTGAYGLEVDMDASSTAGGAIVFQNGSSDGLISVVAGGGYGMYTQINGTGGGVYNDINGTATIGSVNDISLNGGIGHYTFMNGRNGNAYYVDSVGGSGFGFLGFVNTTTPSTGGSVFGAVIGAEQWGVGHGIILNHRGASGRNAEFNINDGNNPDAAIFTITQGPGSAIIGQNQDNTITGTVSVADFAYTGTDVADHIGVEGSSTPLANWGIGVYGTGNWYGVYSNGNMGSNGTKTFIIDHPAEPTQKFLRHFSTESDEVLNMYRGMIQLDANGEATVQLPDYFQLININFSYQLTPVGTPVQPYVAEEIQGTTFKVAGAPNTKVSWMVLAERNDPYMQQHPEHRGAVVEKQGARAGKYLNPTTYGAPASQGINYNPHKGSTKSQSVTTIDRSNTNAALKGKLHQDVKLERTGPETQK